jgi:tetratricopeptide (TPR) repeat protein
MLDEIDIEENITNNQDNYEGLISTIEISQGMLVLIIASCAPGAFQDELIDRYEAELAPSIPSYRIELDRSEPSLRQALEELVERQPELKESKAPAAITVTGAANLRSIPLGDTETNSALDRFFGYLQWTREGLREFPYPIVLWVTPQILTRLSAKAPDFWSWRGGVFRFTAPVVAKNGFRSMPMRTSSLKTERTSDLPINELLEQVAQIEAKNPHSPALATLFDRLGQAYASQMNIRGAENQASAIEYFQHALRIQTELNLKHSKVYTLLRLVEVYFNLGNYQQAESLVRDTLTIATELGDRFGIANSLISLGYIACKQGNYDEAEALSRQCLAFYTEIGDQSGIANSFDCLGDIARKRGNYDEAEALFQQSLLLRNEIGNQSEIASVWGCLGDIARNRGNYDEAEALYQQSLALYNENGDWAGIASVWGCMGENELERGSLESAEIWLQKSLIAMENLQMLHGIDIAEINWDLAKLYRAKSDEPQAQQHYLIAHNLYTKLGAKKDLERIESEWSVSPLTT